MTKNNTYFDPIAVQTLNVLGQNLQTGKFGKFAPNCIRNGILFPKHKSSLSHAYSSYSLANNLIPAVAKIKTGVYGCCSTGMYLDA